MALYLEGTSEIGVLSSTSTPYVSHKLVGMVASTWVEGEVRGIC